MLFIFYILYFGKQKQVNSIGNKNNSCGNRIKENSSVDNRNYELERSRDVDEVEELSGQELSQAHFNPKFKSEYSYGCKYSEQ